MTADSQDGFDYLPASEHASEQQRRHYWAVAIGLQAIDNLEVSDYVRDVSRGYIRGDYSLSHAGDLVRAFHENGSNTESCEADLVSQRIAELLAASPFVLLPRILSDIHRYLFQDLDPAIYHPGEFKKQRMIKQEPILNGDSILYADPLAYDSSLSMVFSAEREKAYGIELAGKDLADFCHTIAFLWQVHPFAEGNTRTIAVFSELYLNHLGFAATNEPFEKHSRYFRGALVRAMYRNAAAKITPTDTFLVNFYDNVVNNANHTLNEEDLVCSVLFENPRLLRNVSPDEALRKDNL